MPERKKASRKKSSGSGPSGDPCVGLCHLVFVHSGRSHCVICKHTRIEKQKAIKSARMNAPGGFDREERSGHDRAG